MVKLRSSTLCRPRWATPRSPERPSLGPAIGKAAASLGLPLMPWQQQVADVGGELLPDGIPAYREVILTVPRQSGKTTLFLGWTIQRALGWAKTLGQSQKIAYSAQTGNDARKKLIEDQVPLLESRKRALGLSKITKGMGVESVQWGNGSRLVLLASTEDSGHGKTVHLGEQDELFADTDFRRDQTLIPAMATVETAQIIKASTAGTADSIAWNAAVDKGRMAVAQGRTTGIAYFEWSADPEEAPDDHQTWFRCMPALGRTITLGAIEHAYTSMKIDEFKRAYLNIPTSANERVIPESIWNLVCAPDVEATAGMFALDVNPERSAAGIVACGTGPILEVIDYRAGTDWLVDRAEELALKYDAPFALDANGPAGSFLADLTERKIKLVELKPQEVVRATGKFYDTVVADDTPLRVRRHADLDAAVAGAAKRPVQDAFVWGRKTSRADICLLVAATVGLWALETYEPEGNTNLW